MCGVSERAKCRAFHEADFCIFCSDFYFFMYFFMSQILEQMEKICCIEDALATEARRISDMCIYLQYLSGVAMDAFDTLDAMDPALPRTQRRLAAADPLRPLGSKAIVECEQRAVVLDGMLERIIAWPKPTSTSTMTDVDDCAHSSSKFDVCLASHVEEALNLIASPLPCSTLAIEALESVVRVVPVISEKNGAQLQASCCTAARAKDVFGLDLLLADGHADFVACGYDVIVAASQRNRLDILQRFLTYGASHIPPLMGHVLDIILLECPATRLEAFFSFMCDMKYCGQSNKNMHWDALFDTALITLLSSNRIDPSARGNIALRVAISSQRPSFVSALLADPRVDPTQTIVDPDDGLTNVLSLACCTSTSRSEAILHLLLRDGRVNPAEHGHAALRTAIRTQNLAATRTLLADPRVDPANTQHDRDETLVMFAIKNDTSVEVLSLLLADGRADPVRQSPVQGVMESPLFYAARHNDMDLMRLLIADVRVDPSVDNNAALRISDIFEYHDQGDMLFADARVQSSLSPEYVRETMAMVTQTTCTLTWPELDALYHRCT